ncbi:hypothetical protein LTR29_009514 [Friedmanniomyces endolithicus]|nr:hypothetical protein LTR29_009514 [Friedmanniomyces endolithicus]
MGVCFIRSLSHSLTRGLIGLSYAASKTIPKGMILHWLGLGQLGNAFDVSSYGNPVTEKRNVTGWFLLPGKADERFIYNVRIIRDGGYSTRGVDVVQESDPGVCFTCICSFKKPEKESTPSIDIRQRLDLRKEFSAVLMNKQPHEHEEMPGVDAPWYARLVYMKRGSSAPY